MWFGSGHAPVKLNPILDLGLAHGAGAAPEAGVPAAEGAAAPEAAIACGKRVISSQEQTHGASSDKSGVSSSAKATASAYAPDSCDPA